ncbi:alpha/beta hydrolase [Bailinhaonella thermotolerans]|uniref:alpha/beta hydrolase n=1 Tax=Bailinhaonella thermotolerans TaxID=1070861 RepID=UPI001A8D5421|nr:alpha/beta hydrolase [Bailinhaonella thermotolerans]
MRGEVYLPSGARPEGGFPAVVVTGSWTTVRQQMPALYARRLAERGHLALAFDFRGYGDSSGTPRDVESPDQKAADIRNAVTFLAGHAQADPGRIGALGLCAGAGYTAAAAARDERLRSLALVAPWLHDAELVEALYGGPEGVAVRRKAGEEAARRWRETGEVTYVPAVSTTDPEAAMYGPFDYYLDPRRGAVPQWCNRFAVMAWPGWLAFNPIAAAPEIHAPALLVHSEAAAIPEGARRFHEALAGPKEFVWTTGGQLDFYDQEPAVTTAVDAAVDHFTATL